MPPIWRHSLQRASLAVQVVSSFVPRSADDAQEEAEGFLLVADADGKNANTIATDKGKFVLGMVLGVIDWG